MGMPIGGYLPNGWSYRLSGNVLMPSDATGYDDADKLYESGVPADIEVEDDLDTPEDEIIEAAIDFIDTYTP